MNREPDWRIRDEPLLQISRLHLVVVLIAWVIGAVVALAGLALLGTQPLAPLVVVLALGIALNILLVWLAQRRVPEWLLTWGGELTNLALLTAAIHLTGGFQSPFYLLYTIYLLIVGLRYGWGGVLSGLLLCLLSWVTLILLAPPSTLEAWIRILLLAGGVVLFSAVVGVLAERYIRFWHEARQRNREIEFLQEAGQSLAASLDPQEVLATTLARVNEVIKVDAASLALVDRETGRITLELAIGGGDKKIEGLRLEPGQGIVGQTIQEGRPILVPDVTIDPRWFSEADKISGYRTRSILSVPLIVQGRVIGALEVLNKLDGPFSEYDQRLLSSLADLAAQSIENARLHEELQQSALRLRDAYAEVHKLDELKSAFIRNVTHELRTPLTLIEGYLELLLDGQMGPLLPQQQQSLTVVAEKSAQLTHLVNDIVSLQAVGAMGFDFEVLSLVSLSEKAVAALRPKADKARIRFELSLPPPEEPAMIEGDARRLYRVLIHLLENAIKFSPNGGTVRAAVESDRETVFVRVTDQGIGLPSAELERVFDRFYQVDGSSTRRYSGIGLGLAHVKEVIEAHGGGVWAESKGPGQGSTFVCFFPAYEGE